VNEICPKPNVVDSRHIRARALIILKCTCLWRVTVFVFEWPTLRTTLNGDPSLPARTDSAEKFARLSVQLEWLILCTWFPKCIISAIGVLAASLWSFKDGSNTVKDVIVGYSFCTAPK